MLKSNLYIKICFLLLITGTFIFSLPSCHDHDSENHNTAVTFRNPSENQIFNVGDTIQLQADVTADISLHGYEVHLHDINSNTFEVIVDKHTHNSTYTIEQNWIADKAGLKKIEVIVYVTHDGDKVSAFRNIEYK
ncbi:MAG: hypothetical protein IPI53_01260 [Saprospiraceae bacterium]|nr:hypothetical protein [Saprospiraceae bacterium]